MSFRNGKIRIKSNEDEEVGENAVRSDQAEVKKNRCRPK